MVPRERFKLGIMNTRHAAGQRIALPNAGEVS
jgi:hypothetical protein